ncbi:MAG: Methionyl-tRNA formyltransferase [Gammaproteobacteria bacterium]|nr:Methionyl-tRNA formyltransferase [Gammaproteobacteria bacterium]
MNKVSLRLAFAGTPELAATILDCLIQSQQHDIAFVITRPDKPVGRGRKLGQSPVKLLTEKHGLPIRQPLRPSAIDSENMLAQTDVLVVAAFGMILPTELLSRPRLGCINVHTSLLPRWRGAAPIQRAIQAGDDKTGVTIMQIEAGLDMGGILLQKECAISAVDTAGSLHDKLASLGGPCLLTALERLAKNALTPKKQDARLATYAAKISKQEATVDWYLSALELERTIRAFNPASVAHSTIQGVAMRIWEADIVIMETKFTTPGTVIDCSVDGIVIATTQAALRIKRLQLPGKKVITAREFLNGYPGLLQPGKP